MSNFNASVNLNVVPTSNLKPTVYKDGDSVEWLTIKFTNEGDRFSHCTVIVAKFVSNSWYTQECSWRRTATLCEKSRDYTSDELREKMVNMRQLVKKTRSKLIEKSKVIAAHYSLINEIYKNFTIIANELEKID